MSGKRYTAEFKQEAVKQILEHGHSAKSVAKRLGVSYKSIYDWLAEAWKSAPRRAEDNEMKAEIARLRAELKRTTEERDILKKAAAYFARHPGEVRLYGRVPTEPHVPGSKGQSKRLLRLAASAKVSAHDTGRATA
jgi:transposase